MRPLKKKNKIQKKLKNQLCRTNQHCVPQSARARYFLGKESTNRWKRSLLSAALTHRRRWPEVNGRKNNSFPLEEWGKKISIAELMSRPQQNTWKCWSFIAKTQQYLGLSLSLSFLLHGGIVNYSNHKLV